MTPEKVGQPTDEGYAAAAWLLMCEPRAMKAIGQIETGAEGAFLPDGRPALLFERHVFRRLTDGRFDHDAPDLSNQEAGGYGRSGAWQHERLARAALLDREAALKSASWGLFQLMGFNHARCGYPDLQRFINAMYRSADDHLRALIGFIRYDEQLVDAIRGRNWTLFARLYNGVGFAINRYDARIAEAYADLAVMERV